MKIQYTVTIDPRDVERITPENLLAYALRTGWVVREDFRHIRLLAPPKNSGDDYVCIQRSSETEGWGLRLEAALQMFSDIEQRDPRDIVRDIVGATSEANGVVT